MNLNDATTIIQLCNELVIVIKDCSNPILQPRNYHMGREITKVCSIQTGHYAPL